MSLKCAHGAAPRGTGGSRSWDGGHGGGGTRDGDTHRGWGLSSSSDVAGGVGWGLGLWVPPPSSPRVGCKRYF